MAEVDRLRDRVRRMERDLNAAMNEQEQRRREIERSNQRQIDRLRRELEQAKRAMDASYAQRVRALSEELTARERRFQQELRRADEQAQTRRAELLKALRDANKELRKEAEEIRRKEYVRTENGRALARERTRYAEERAAAVERTPHEFFCPGQLALFREHLTSVQDMISSGMYEAAAATAAAAGAELELLEINVRQRRREWEEMYAAYRETILRVRDKLERFQTEELLTPCGRFRMNDSERDYWSRNHYRAIRADAESACAMVERWARDVMAQVGANFPQLKRVCAALADVRGDEGWNYTAYKLQSLLQNVEDNLIPQAQEVLRVGYDKLTRYYERLHALQIVGNYMKEQGYSMEWAQSVGDDATQKIVVHFREPGSGNTVAVSLDEQAGAEDIGRMAMEVMFNYANGRPVSEAEKSPCGKA